MLINVTMRDSKLSLTYTNNNAVLPQSARYR